MAWAFKRSSEDRSCHEHSRQHAPGLPDVTRTLKPAKRKVTASRDLTAERSAEIASSGKAKTIARLDADLIAYFRARADATGVGYQTIINAALRNAVAEVSGSDNALLTIETLPQVLREEKLHAA